MRSVLSEEIGLPAGYEIFEDGRLLSRRLGAARWLRSGVMKTGYPAFNVKVGGVRHAWTVHRLLAKAFIPNPLGKPQVNHLDGNKQNNALSNLEWVTDRENKHHAHRAGLVPRDTEKCRKANHRNALAMIRARRRFSQEQVAQIKAMRADGATYHALGRHFKCDHGTARSICLGLSYITDIREAT